MQLIGRSLRLLRLVVSPLVLSIKGGVMAYCQTLAQSLLAEYAQVQFPAFGRLRGRGPGRNTDGRSG